MCYTNESENYQFKFSSNVRKYEGKKKHKKYEIKTVYCFSDQKYAIKLNIIVIIITCLGQFPFVENQKQLVNNIK